MRHGFEVFQALLAPHSEAIQRQQPIMVEVRNLETFQRQVVHCLVSETGAGLVESHDLWLRDKSEVILEKPWRIQVLSEVDEEETLQMPATQRTASVYRYAADEPKTR